jgi:hypothetical protein
MVTTDGGHAPTGEIAVFGPSSQVMRVLPLVLVVLCLTFSGCRKKSYREFYEAERNYQVMVAREGEDAYALPEMDQVLSVLKATPAGAIEEPKARTLVETIERERARLASERAQAERLVNEGERPVDFPTEGVAPPAEPATVGEAVPAEPGTPQPGMDEAAFKQQFGACISGPETLDLPTGKHPAYAGKDDDRCRKMLGTKATTSFFFINGKLAGQSISQVDAAAVAAAAKARKDAEAAQANANANAKKEEYLLVPGAPLPKGLQGNVPPANTGAMPAAPTGDGIKEAPVVPTLPARTE